MSKSRAKYRTKYHAHSDFRTALLEVYGHKCMVCGYSSFVEAHHITPRSESNDNSFENGILLCPNHHREADNKVISADCLRDIKRTYPKIKEKITE